MAIGSTIGVVAGFPAAGGSTTDFRLIGAANPTARLLNVRYPGETKPLRLWAQDIAYTLLDTVDTTPTVLVGASLGATVALEVAQYMSEYGRHPSAVIMIGAAAPQAQVPRPRRVWEDRDIVDLIVRSLGALPASFSVPAVRQYAIEKMRRDLEWGGAYDGPGPIPLSCPLVALRGTGDPIVLDGRGTVDWARWTTGTFLSRTVPGGHLFFTDPAGAHAVWAALADCTPNVAREGQLR